MSIASEISRLQSSKADVKTQVNIDKDLINNGTAFIASETVDDYDDCIEEMQDAYKKFIPIQSESGTTEVTIDNTGSTKHLMSVQIDGNALQNETPVPTSPVNVNVVTGENVIIVTDSNNIQSQSYTISLGSLELCKIGDYKDRLYESGDKWYKYGAIKKIVLDKTKNWGYYSVTQGSLFRSSNTTGGDDVSDQTYVPLCTHYQGISFYNSSNRANNNLYINKDNHNLDLLDNRFTSADSFKTWIGNNNVIVYYPLATAIITEITDSTLISQLEAIRFETGINNISIDGDTAVSGFTIKFIGEAAEHP